MAQLPNVRDWLRDTDRNELLALVESPDFMVSTEASDRAYALMVASLDPGGDDEEKSKSEPVDTTVCLLDFETGTIKVIGNGIASRGAKPKDRSKLTRYHRLVEHCETQALLQNTAGGRVVVFKVPTAHIQSK